MKFGQSRPLESTHSTRDSAKCRSVVFGIDHLLYLEWARPLIAQVLRSHNVEIELQIMPDKKVRTLNIPLEVFHHLFDRDPLLLCSLGGNSVNLFGNKGNGEAVRPDNEVPVRK